MKLVNLSSKNNPNVVWYICPTESLRALIRKHAKKLLPKCNYIMEYKDAQGFGIELAYSKEIEAGSLATPATYTLPNPLYKNPGYDLVNI